jgi:hypothetical protein
MRWRTVSGHCDSIRERRARESWENGWEEEGQGNADADVVVPTLGLLAAAIFQHPEEATAFVEKVISRRLDLEYIRWNGKTSVRFIGVVR